nr:hypothetical protein [bacterium]
DRIQVTLVELRQSGLADVEIRNTFLRLLGDGSSSESAAATNAGDTLQSKEISS